MSRITEATPSVHQLKGDDVRQGLAKLADAAPNARWIAHGQGHFEKAALGATLIQKFRGLGGLGDRSNKIALEYELISILAQGGAQNIFNAKDLELIKKAAQQAGLAFGNEESVRDHADLAGVINLLAENLLNHKQIPTESYLAYANRFAYHHQNQLKALAVPQLLPVVSFAIQSQVHAQESSNDKYSYKEHDEESSKNEGSQSFFTSQEEHSNQEAPKEKNESVAPTSLAAEHDVKPLSKPVSLQSTLADDSSLSREIALEQLKFEVIGIDWHLYEKSPLSTCYALLTGALRPSSSAEKPLDTWLINILSLAEGFKDKDKASTLTQLSDLDQKVGFDNALALLARGYQLSLHFVVHGTKKERALSMNALEAFETQFKALLAKNSKYSFDIENLDFDRKAVDPSFIQSLEKAAWISKRNRLALGVGLTALTGVGAFYAYKKYTEKQPDPVITKPDDNKDGIGSGEGKGEEVQKSNWWDTIYEPVRSTTRFAVDYSINATRPALNYSLDMWNNPAAHQLELGIGVAGLTAVILGIGISCLTGKGSAGKTEKKDGKETKPELKSFSLAPALQVKATELSTIAINISAKQKGDPILVHEPQDLRNNLQGLFTTVTDLSTLNDEGAKPHLLKAQKDFETVVNYALPFAKPGDALPFSASASTNQLFKSFLAQIEDVFKLEDGAAKKDAIKKLQSKIFVQAEQLHSSYLKARSEPQLYTGPGVEGDEKSEVLSDASIQESIDTEYGIIKEFLTQSQSIIEQPKSGKNDDKKVEPHLVPKISSNPTVTAVENLNAITTARDNFDQYDRKDLLAAMPSYDRLIEDLKSNTEVDKTNLKETVKAFNEILERALPVVSPGDKLPGKIIEGYDEADADFAELVASINNSEPNMRVDLFSDLKSFYDTYLILRRKADADPTTINEQFKGIREFLKQSIPVASKQPDSGKGALGASKESSGGNEKPSLPRTDSASGGKDEIVGPKKTHPPIPPATYPGAPEEFKGVQILTGDLQVSLSVTNEKISKMYGSEARPVLDLNSLLEKARQFEEQPKNSALKMEIQKLLPEYYSIILNLQIQAEDAANVQSKEHLQQGAEAFKKLLMYASKQETALDTSTANDEILEAYFSRIGNISAPSAYQADARELFSDILLNLPAIQASYAKVKATANMFAAAGIDKQYKAIINFLVSITNVMKDVQAVQVISNVVKSSAKKVEAIEEPPKVKTIADRADEGAVKNRRILRFAKDMYPSLDVSDSWKGFAYNVALLKEGLNSIGSIDPKARVASLDKEDKDFPIEERKNVQKEMTNYLNALVDLYESVKGIEDKSSELKAARKSLDTLISFSLGDLDEAIVDSCEIKGVNFDELNLITTGKNLKELGLVYAKICAQLGDIYTQASNARPPEDVIESKEENVPLPAAPALAPPLDSEVKSAPIKRVSFERVKKFLYSFSQLIQKMYDGTIQATLPLKNDSHLDIALLQKTFTEEFSLPSLSEISTQAGKTTTLDTWQKFMSSLSNKVPVHLIVNEFALAMKDSGKKGDIEKFTKNFDNVLNSFVKALGRPEVLSKVDTTNALTKERVVQIKENAQCAYIKFLTSPHESQEELLEAYKEVFDNLHGIQCARIKAQIENKFESDFKNSFDYLKKFVKTFSEILKATYEASLPQDERSKDPKAGSKKTESSTVTKAPQVGGELASLAMGVVLKSTKQSAQPVVKQALTPTPVVLSKKQNSPPKAEESSTPASTGVNQVDHRNVLKKKGSSPDKGPSSDQKTIKSEKTDFRDVLKNRGSKSPEKESDTPSVKTEKADSTGEEQPPVVNTVVEPSAHKRKLPEAPVKKTPPPVPPKEGRREIPIPTASLVKVENISEDSETAAVESDGSEGSESPTEDNRDRVDNAEASLTEKGQDDMTKNSLENSKTWFEIPTEEVPTAIVLTTDQ